MSDFITPSKPPPCEHCGKPRTITGRGEWICEPCRLKASDAGRKEAKEARARTSYKTPSKAPLCEHCRLPKTVSGQAQWICEPCRLAACEAGKKARQRTHCDGCGEPLTPRRDGRGLICVPCRAEHDRMRREAVNAQDVEGIVLGNGQETLERLGDLAVTDTVRMRINPKLLRGEKLSPGDPLYIPA